ncbi:cephalosporin hydroxylase family protein [Gammaproteobacteria bacterium]|nr:cephalosporin hydroxylase family protein [Gammaproteobacteria bacterium]
MDHEADVIENVKRNALNDNFSKVSMEFIRESVTAKYSYNFSWLGRPIIQYPQDVMALQEIIWSVQPDLIIETGIAHGGSLIFSAAMMELLDICSGSETNSINRKVMGIDIELREHNRIALDAHPLRDRIMILEGSSISPVIIEQVRDVAYNHERSMVCLDSNHAHEHVLAELSFYAPLVSIGSYCVVFDTLIEDLPSGSFPDRPWDKGDNPKTAVRHFLSEHANFEIDTTIESKLMITAAPEGYLKRVR